MNRTILLATACLVALLALAAHPLRQIAAQPPAKAAKPNLGPSEKANLDTLSLMAPGHLGAFLFWPQAWPAFAKYISPVAKAAGAPAETLDILNSGVAFDDFLEAALGQDLGLNHWDQSRPILFAFYEATQDYSDPFKVVDALLTHVGDPTATRPMPYRHRVLVPATDARVLANEIATLFQTDGFSTVDHNLDGAPPGTLAIHAGDTLITISPEKTFVRVEAAFGIETQQITTDLLKDMLDFDVLPLDVTPAVRQTIAEGQLVSLLFRTTQLRESFCQAGLASIMSALGGVATEHVQLMMSMGLGELLRGYSQLDPALSLHGDIGVGIGVSDAIHLRFIANNTSYGKKILEAAIVPEKGFKITGAANRPATFVVNLDWAAVVANSRLAPDYPVGSAPGLEDWERSFSENLYVCGPTCSAFTVFGGWPWPATTLIQAVMQHYTGGQTAPLPHSLGFAVNLGPQGTTPTFDSAWVFPANTNGTAVASSANNIAVDLGFKPDARTMSNGDYLLLSLGLDQPAESPFVIGRASNARTLWELNARPNQFAAFFDFLDHEAGQPLLPVQSLAGKAILADTSVIGDIVLVIQPDPTTRPAIEPNPWEPPAPTAMPTSQTHDSWSMCKAVAAEVLGRGLEAQAQVAPEKQLELALQTITTLDQQLTCTGKDSNLVKERNSFLWSATQLLAFACSQEGSDDSRKVLFTKTCELGVKDACTALKSLKK